MISSREGDVRKVGQRIGRAEAVALLAKQSKRLVHPAFRDLELAESVHLHANVSQRPRSPGRIPQPAAQLQSLLMERFRPCKPALFLRHPTERREGVNDPGRVTVLARQRQRLLTERLRSVVVAKMPCEPTGLSQDGGL